ncbi:MAG: aminotransferase class V-fold PLP-dependent enzyme [Rhodobacteraceae bacterium]|nr:aminotransferase class V-fold PLP-dependent enzyme [Paracoccaceae bacterium]
MNRVYLDWNATAPLRPKARAAMLDAMDCLGNPSSVHAEGRAAKAIVEKARGQVADLVGCDREGVVFTSGATESAAMVLSSRKRVFALPYEHDSVLAWADEFAELDEWGLGEWPEPKGFKPDIICWQRANSETGVVQSQPPWIPTASTFIDLVQSVSRLEHQTPFIESFGILSSHKFGGPKGAGALILGLGAEIGTKSAGSGQEKGRRSGTENVVGIAGMGAAAEAAAKDLADGVWLIVEQNRNVFEERLLNEVPELIIFGKDVERLPNTSYFAVPGWKAETQVMQMDLAGFAVSAGSACSSGKVKASRVLKAMGYDEITAGSAIRVSIGPSTTAAELDSFADAWLKEYKRFKARR